MLVLEHKPTAFSSSPPIPSIFHSFLVLITGPQIIIKITKRVLVPHGNSMIPTGGGDLFLLLSPSAATHTSVIRN